MDETLKNAEQLVESTRLYPPAATQHTSLKGGSTPISRSAPTDFLGTHNFLWGDEMPCEPYLESVLCVKREAIVQRVSAKIRATSISTVSRFHLLLQVLSMHCNLTIVTTIPPRPPARATCKPGSSMQVAPRTPYYSSSGPGIRATEASEGGGYAPARGTPETTTPARAAEVSLPRPRRALLLRRRSWS